MENYTIDYFIKKFEAILEQHWYSGGYKNPLNFSQRCAYGHCNLDDNKQYAPEGIALSEISIRHFGASHILAEINDGKSLSYQQPTPKQRVLAALYDIKAKEQRVAPEPVKPAEKIVYVTIDKEVKELTKQPQLN